MSSLPDADLNRPHYLYRCFDAQGQLLYVGVTRDVGSRMFHHLHICNIGKQPNGTLRRLMTDYSVERHETKLEVRVAERFAIQTEGPLLNKQHNVRRFRKVNNATYALLEPVHPITAAAFPDLPRIARQETAA